MKKLVRKSVWETNSSSSHSISLAGDDKQFVMDTIYPDQFGRIYVRGGEYGWEWERYNDAETKLSYAYQDNVPEDLLERVIKAHTGATEVVFDKTSKENGYIDHESYATASSVCVDEDSTKNFIFNKNSWLFTGNDNGYPDPTFYHVPVFENGKVIMPVYKYELSIDGLKKTTKFIENPEPEKLAEAIESLMQGVYMYDDGTMTSEEENNIYFQISRRRDLFEYSWRANQDYSRGYIVMTREGNGVYAVEERLKKEGKFEGLDWMERAQIFTEEVLKDNNLARKVNFKLTEI